MKKLHTLKTVLCLVLFVTVLGCNRTELCCLLLHVG